MVDERRLYKYPDIDRERYTEMRTRRTVQNNEWQTQFTMIPKEGPIMTETLTCISPMQNSKH